MIELSCPAANITVACKRIRSRDIGRSAVSPPPWAYPTTPAYPSNVYPVSALHDTTPEDLVRRIPRQTSTTDFRRGALAAGGRAPRVGNLDDLDSGNRIVGRQRHGSRCSHCGALPMPRPVVRRRMSPGRGADTCDVARRHAVEINIQTFGRKCQTLKRPNAGLVCLTDVDMQGLASQRLFGRCPADWQEDIAVARVPAGRADRGSSERKRREERWPELLEVAAEFFYEYGYDATSVQDIAQRLGMLKGSLYYYINTKEDLLYEVISDVFQRGRANLAALIERPGNPVQRLYGVIVGQIVYAAENPIASAVFLHEMKALSEERKHAIVGDEIAYGTTFVDLIKQGQRAGLIREEIDPTMASLSIIGAMNWVYRWFRPDGEYSAEQVGQHFADINLRGIATPDGVKTLPAMETKAKGRRRVAR